MSQQRRVPSVVPPPQAVQTSLWAKLSRHDWANNLGIFAYSSASLTFPVLLIAIMSDFGISLEQGGKSLAASLSLGRNISATLTLAFSGFASLYWGNRRCLRFAMLCSGFFVGLATFSTNYLLLLLALILMGVGEGLLEGLLTPFVEELHRDDLGNCSKYVNLAHSFWPAGVISATLLSGWLLNIAVDWRWILGAIALLYFVPFVMLRPLPAAGRPRLSAESSSSLLRESMLESLRGGRDILCTLPYWRFSAAMFLAGGAEITLSFWAASFVQIYYQSSAFIGGLSTAMFALGMLLGRMLTAHYLPPRLLRPALLCCAAAGAASSLFLVFSSKLWLFLLLLLISGLWTAPYWPTIQVYTVERFPKLNRTLLFILLSASGVPGAGFFPWLLGLVSDHSELLGTSWDPFALSLLLVPVCHLAIFMLLLRK